MMARQGAAARKQAIPFAPFLALGGIVGQLFGEDIVDWYVGTLPLRWAGASSGALKNRSRLAEMPKGRGPARSR